ncbi:MAG TPA: BadF/BadG/BcrA/BcrD ATPase family protein [Pyrinomonadaceae bacterium]|jgi:N-acetylglucosamine kinase-like BadF-type ATPase
MKAKEKSKSPKLVAAAHAAPARAAELVIGVDGGGTKTRAIVVDEHEGVLGEGRAGPSNPLRVGVVAAATAIRQAVDRACVAAGVRRGEIVAAEIGLAGVKRLDLRERMTEALKELGIGRLEVVSDADIALFGATDGKPGLVIIAGTGSVCCGTNARGKHACAGGWGPIVGDEGSGSWIARRGLQAVAKATDGRAPKTPLVEAARKYFNVAIPEDLATAIYTPSMTNDRIAGFARYVIDAARARDAVAREIVSDAGRELGAAAVAIIDKLHMGRESFQVGYVGGVFAAGDLVLLPLRQEIQRAAPKARLAPPLFAPAEAAARMAQAAAHAAREQPRQLALAG